MSGFSYTLRHFASDLASMILFYGIVLITHDVLLATSVGIGAGVLQVGWRLARRRPVGALQWASLGLVAIFGAATLVTRDARFIMLKPTAINLILGAVMLKPGWMERYVPAEHLGVARPLLTRFGYVWAGLMLFTAALNLVLVVVADSATWARFNLLFPPISILALFLFQNLYMRRRAGLADATPAR